MVTSISSIDKFTNLKNKRDALSRQLATYQGKLDSAKDRYQDIMRELASYGIGSVGELQAKIFEIDKQIVDGVQEAERLLVEMEEQLREIDNQEIGSSKLS